MHLFTSKWCNFQCFFTAKAFKILIVTNFAIRVKPSIWIYPWATNLVLTIHLSSKKKYLIDPIAFLLFGKSVISKVYYHLEPSSLFPLQGSNFSYEIFWCFLFIETWLHRGRGRYGSRFDLDSSYFKGFWGEKVCPNRVWVTMYPRHKTRGSGERKGYKHTCASVSLDLPCLGWTQNLRFRVGMVQVK